MVHFGQVPLGGLLLNVPAIPAANVALGAGLGMVLAAAPAPWAADAFAAVAEISTAALLGINAAGAAGTEWSIVQGFIQQPTTVFASYAAILSLAAWRVPRARWRLLAASAALAAVAPAWAVAAGTAGPRLDAVFLDVGQGDATLLSLPGPVHVLVDAGPRDATWDAGARTVVPHLRRHGVRELAAVIVSHPHADHFGGLEAVLLSTPVRRLIVNGQPTDHPLWERAMSVADSLGVPVDTVHAGDSVDVGPYARARVLSPRGPPAAEDDPNDGSIVLWVQYGRTALLLTGDAEKSAEWDLVERYGARLRAEAVKIGHHGSRTSSTPAFVSRAATPGGWAVVQVARRNRYGLPDEEPLQRWAEAGTRVALTSSSGAVWLRSRGQVLERVTWRD
jgi:competence protein ComEC